MKLSSRAQPLHGTVVRGLCANYQQQQKSARLPPALDGQQPYVLMVFLCVSMVFLCLSMVFISFSMVFYGFSMCFYGFSMFVYGFL
jgi:hypothetical protein